MVFASNRKGQYNLYQKLLDGTAAEELLLESSLHKLGKGCALDIPALCIRLRSLCVMSCEF